MQPGRRSTVDDDGEVESVVDEATEPPGIAVLSGPTVRIAGAGGGGRARHGPHDKGALAGAPAHGRTVVDDQTCVCIVCFTPDVAFSTTFEVSSSSWLNL